MVTLPGNILGLSCVYHTWIWICIWNSSHRTPDCVDSREEKKDSFSTLPYLLPLNIKTSFLLMWTFWLGLQHVTISYLFFFFYYWNVWCSYRASISLQLNTNNKYSNHLYRKCLCTVNTPIGWLNVFLFDPGLIDQHYALLFFTWELYHCVLL